MSSDDDDGQGKRRIHQHHWRPDPVTAAVRHLDLVEVARGRTEAPQGHARDNRGNRADVRYVPSVPILSRRCHPATMGESIVKSLPRNYYDWDKLGEWKRLLGDGGNGWTFEEYLTPGNEDYTSLVIPTISAGTNPANSGQTLHS